MYDFAKSLMAGDEPSTADYNFISVRVVSDAAVEELSIAIRQSRLTARFFSDYQVVQERHQHSLVINKRTGLVQRLSEASINERSSG